MAEITKNLGLVKPEENDFYDIHIQNQNTDKIDAAIANKVAKEAGKGLSEENYTAAEKAKLTGVEEKANHYLHPAQHAAGMIAYEDNRGIGGNDLQTVIDIVTDRVMNQLVEKNRIVKNFTTAEEGYVADATLVKELNDRVVEQNNNFAKIVYGMVTGIVPAHGQGEPIYHTFDRTVISIAISQAGYGDHIAIDTYINDNLAIFIPRSIMDIGIDNVTTRIRYIAILQ